MIVPNKNVFTRIGISKISGVGVFAIIGIPKGTFVFNGEKSEMLWFKEDELELDKLPENIRNLYEDFCVIKRKGNTKIYGCPDNFNNMTISWYLNNSDKPNMACDKDYDFYTIRDILADEELTVNYDTYSD